jgi:catechol 2,3-dioxygenase-like lactoylglutathione lyase family enzyme
MLKDADVAAVVAVKDLEKARSFYEDKLGLEEAKKDPSGGGVLYKSGNSNLFVYETQVAAWSVDNVEGAVEELKSKGVTFEHYDLPGATLEGDIHVMGELKAAWFMDPDGNILNIVSGM